MGGAATNLNALLKMGRARFGGLGAAGEPPGGLGRSGRHGFCGLGATEKQPGGSGVLWVSKSIRFAGE